MARATPQTLPVLHVIFWDMCAGYPDVPCHGRSACVSFTARECKQATSALEALCVRLEMPPRDKVPAPIMCKAGTSALGCTIELSA